MESLARGAARRPVGVTVLAIVLTILGVASWPRLALDLFPDLQSPTVLVSVNAGNRPPIEMERLYGERIEQLLFTVHGLRAVDQVARTGRLVTRVTFDWDVDLDYALVDVSKAVAPIGADPDVDEVLVRRFDPRQLPILTLGLVAPSGTPDLAELKRIAERQLAPALQRLAGVAEVRVTGGRDREVQVRLDGTRLAAHGVTLNEVETRIRATNVDRSAGTLVEDDRVYLVRGLTRFASAADVANTVVRYLDQPNGGKTALKVSDLGEVIVANADITHLVRVDGSEGVGLDVYKEAGANTVAVSRTVRDALANLGADLPGVAVRVIGDEAALVEDSIADVESSALLGIGLAMLVLALFLRGLGPILIVAAAVPVSLFVTVFAMKFAGHSLNLMTLGGLALGAGMLVDNAIVVVESIFRQRAAGLSARDAAARGAGLVGTAIASSTLTTCVVFLPVLFVEGMAARLVSGIAFTVVLSLLASLAVALVLVPALAAWFLPKQPARGLDVGSACIERLVTRLLQRPWTVIAVAAALSALSCLALLRLGSELLPPADPRQLGLRLVGTPGQRVESMAQSVAIVEDLLRGAAGTELVALRAEVGRLPNDDRLIRERQTEEHTAEIRARLAADGRGAGALAGSIQPVLAQLHGLDAEWDTGGSALATALGIGGPPVVVEIRGQALEDLRRAGTLIRDRLAARDELWNVRTSFEGGPPEARLHLAQARADGLGVDLEQLTGIVAAALDGRRATTLTLGDEEQHVVLYLTPPARGTLTELPFLTRDGARLPVGDVATLEPVAGANEIFRRDQRRVAQVTARIRAGVTAPAARAATQAALAEVALPPGLGVTLAGDELERSRTLTQLQWAGALALLLVLMVLAASFESLLHPLTVLSSIPISLIGVALALVPFGQPLGVMALLGLIVLAGIAVNDSILLIEQARQLVRDGCDTATALARAAALRLRPIVMTTATTVFALLPLAFGQGESARLRAPLALTVAGGVTASLVASLVVIPCVFLVLERLRRRAHRA
ncbi:MAG: efflux RND transporter permease subunit [Gammaproteobacteria bacterium]|nr:efflux RND transporter permease subunit [Gammaproteobacteria bacterium]